MKIVEIFPDCGAEPIWLACIPSGFHPDAVRIVVCDDNPPIDFPRYGLHIACRETNVDGVAHLHGLHRGPDAEACGISLAQNRDAFCVNHKTCPLRLLAVEELFYPLVIDELCASESAMHPHGYN